MKKSFVFIFILLFCKLTLKAQIHVGSNEIPSMNRPGKIRNQDYEAFKRTTTLFTLQYKDYTNIEDFERILKDVWTITPFKIIRPDEMDGYLQSDGYSFFTYGGYLVQRQGSSGSSTSNMHLSYDLWLPASNNKKTVKQKYLARIGLFPDAEVFRKAQGNVNFFNRNAFSQKLTSFLYNEAVFYNWGSGYLKGYLSIVNAQLLKKEERGPYTEEVDKNALKPLTGDTLYVPDYVQIKASSFTGAEVRNNDGNYGKNYPYPIRIINSEELNALITNNAPIKYLVYVKSSTDKFISVYENNKDKVLYTQYVKLSYNFRGKDLDKLAKNIPD